jgi:uncharacterized membrane protein
MAAPPFDYLDSMAWDVAISAVLVGVAALRLPYKASSDSVEEGGKNLRMGLAAGIGLTGLYLLIAGLGIGFIWPFTPAGGSYNVLFGGVSALSGLALIATSLALFFNGGIKAVSYFAAVVGVYAVIDAYSMLKANLTSTPQLAALSFLAFSATAFLSVPATHSDNKWLRRLFALVAFLFAIAWIYEAANITLGHLGAK